MLPDDPVARRLSAQSILFALGDGIFTTGNAVYFTQIIGLSAAQVGLGLSITGVVALVLSVPLGRVADRFGARRMWALGASLEALLYLTYPAVHGFAAFVALLACFTVVNSIGGAGRGAYSIAIFPRAERVRYQAFLRAALNIGFTLGALVSGLALASDNDDVDPLAAGLHRGRARRERRPHRAPPGAGRSTTAEEPGNADEPTTRSSPKALKNRGFVAYAVLSGISGTHWILLTVVIPLWLVERTDAPHWTLAWLFATNTVLCVLLPGACGARHEQRARRAARCPAGGGVHGVFVRHRGRHRRHDRLGLGRAAAGRPHDRHRRRAVRLGRELGLPVRAVRPIVAASTRACGGWAPGSPTSSDPRRTPGWRWTTARWAGS